MSNKRFVFSTLVVWSLAAVPMMSQAQTESVGYVKTVTGAAWITTAGQRVKAQPGTPILMGRQLKTAPAASLGVTFKDNTVMSFGPDTELTVDEYLYAPAKGQLGIAARLDKGTLTYISGVIAKLKPEAVSVKTPAGIIGVRGTSFMAMVEESQ